MPRPFKQQRPQRAAPATRPIAEDVKPQRLHKLLALAGLGSRRDMEELIASGRITINGKTAQVGAGVVPTDVVRLDSRPLRLPFEPELPRVLLYHKPEVKSSARTIRKSALPYSTSCRTSAAASGSPSAAWT